MRKTVLWSVFLFFFLFFFASVFGLVFSLSAPRPCNFLFFFWSFPRVCISFRLSVYFFLSVPLSIYLFSLSFHLTPSFLFPQFGPLSISSNYFDLFITFIYFHRIILFSHLFLSLLTPVFLLMEKLNRSCAISHFGSGATNISAHEENNEAQLEEAVCKRVFIFPALFLLCLL